jgi:hypothetical protein
LARAAEPGDAELIAALAPAHARLQKAHTLFAAKGVALPPLPPLGGDAPDEAAAEESGGSSGAISFTKQVAPILVARCGMCHMRRSMGEFSMATFAALSRGGENGPVIEAGQPEESLLVELVESGEMPPPRPRPRPVPPREVELIKDWVAQGAKFDGAGEDAPLLEMAPQRRTRNP